VKKVYYVIEGVVDFMVEDRCSAMLKKIKEDGRENVNPTDLILSPEIHTDTNLTEGQFFLFEHCLYEPFIPFRVVCRTQCKLLEIEGSLFKVHCYGSSG